jgi:hypothetical protein
MRARAAPTGAYEASTGIRTGVAIGELSRPPKWMRSKRAVAKLAHLDVVKGPSAAFFGDDSGTVYALDAQKGTLLWRVQVDTHPLARIAATPTPYQNRLYVAVSSGEEAKAASPDYPCCTFRGSVVALDMITGHVLWKTYTITDAARPTGTNAAGLQGFGPAGAAISTAPTVDTKRNAVYVGTGRSFGGDARAHGGGGRGARPHRRQRALGGAATGGRHRRPCGLRRRGRYCAPCPTAAPSSWPRRIPASSPASTRIAPARYAGKPRRTTPASPAAN